MSEPIFSTPEEMFDQLEFCHYEAIGGYLEMNVAYGQLKQYVSKAVADLLQAREQIAALQKQLAEAKVKQYAQENGYIEVWRSWKDTMLKQGRNVPNIRIDLSTLPKEDIDLDRQIALDVVMDFIVWTTSHPHDTDLQK